MNYLQNFFNKPKELLNIQSLNTITTKLLMLMLFMTIIPLMVLAQFSTDLIETNMKSQATWQLELNNRIGQNQYKESLKTLKNLIVQGLSTPLEESYFDFKNTQNKNALIHKLKNLIRKGDLSFIFILDKNKEIVGSSSTYHQEGTLGSFSDLLDKVFLNSESLASTEIFQSNEVLKEGNQFAKKAEITSEKGNTVYITGLCQVVALPIINTNGDTEAVAIVGNLLTNYNVIGDSVKDLTGATFMIAQIVDNNEAVVISTNLTNVSGSRATGEIFTPAIVNDVLALKVAQSREWQIREYQMALYHPITNIVGNVVGIIYIGIPETQFTTLAKKNMELVGRISVLGLFCAILLTSIFSRSITSPILKLAEAAKQISQGDLNVRVEVEGSSEISQMGKTFNNMAENLQKEERLRDDFVATLTHDLKVPLLAENQTLSYMIKGSYGEINEEQKEVLEVIKNTNEGTLGMVNTLLEVYRYDAGKNILLKSQLDIRDLIEKSVNSLKALADEKKINLSISTPPEKIFVAVDEREIKRVMHNLLANAIASTLRRGSIRVNVERYKNKRTYKPLDKDFQLTSLEKELQIENHVIISVYDTGIGMEQEDMDNLFKRFSGNKGRKPSSIGLGLYYSQQVIDAHKGFIWAESQEGQGTVFKFTLPTLMK